MHEEVGVQRVGVVVIEPGTLFEAKVVAIPVITVVLEQADLLATKAVDDAPYHSGLSRPGAAGDANHEGGTHARIITKLLA
jgi:hypothetical protein